MKKRLSFLIPLLLMGFSLVSSVLIYLQEDRQNRRLIEAHMVREIGVEMGQLQSILYNRLTEGDEAEALLSLSLVAMRPGISNLVLADDRHRVLLSNHFRWKGEPVAGHTAYSEADARQVGQGERSRLAFNARQPTMLQGYFPLIVTYRHGGLEKQMGMLYVEADISEQVQAARRDSLDQALVFGLITLLASLVIAYILHRLVSRRVGVLVAAADRFAAGDFATQTGLQGEDELSELGKRFDLMAQRVGDSLRQRARAVGNLQHVLDATVDGYLLLDGHGCVLDVNRSYCRMTGYSREELLRMCVPQLEAREQSPQAVRAHMDAISERGWDVFETRHRCMDGTEFDVEVSASYSKAEDRFFVFVRDITDRVDTRNVLERERALLEDAQNVGHFGSWELDLTSEELFWSDQIFSIFEIDRSQFGASYEAFLAAVHPDDRDKVERAYSESLESRNPYQITHC